MALTFAVTVATAATALGLGTPVASAATLDVTFAGSGTGTVTSDPIGINCSNVPGSTNSACSHDFGLYFGSGKLTAIPGEGYAFLGWAGSAGGTCSTGTANPCTTGFLYSGALAATATFVPEPDAPTATTGAVNTIAFPSATVTGTVNPNSDLFALKSCYFEYGPTTEYGQQAPCHPGAIGAGSSPVAVSTSIGVLEPGRTYHYRLVAANGGGIGRGADQTFTSHSAPADNCPNATIRAQQGVLAQRLPDCGAYELVSPPFAAGQRAVSAVGTADGDRVMLSSQGGFAGVENLPDLGVAYATERADSGWKSSAIAPPASVFPYLESSKPVLDWTRDNSRSLWFANLKADEGTNRFTPIMRDPDGSFHVAGVTQDDIGTTSQPVPPFATSEDLGTVLQLTYTRPPLTDGTVDTRSVSPQRQSLYASTRGADGQLRTRQVAYKDGETMFPSCSAGASENTARNVVSNDGRKIFFTAACSTPSASAERVWVKIDDDDPIDLSASQCQATCGPERTAKFRGASRDGSRVYFTTEQRLVPEDPDADSAPSADLYEYDFNATGSKLRLVTSGPGTGGAAVLTVLRVSDDGAYVYFIARDRALAGENARGDSPQSGGMNLYVSHRDRGQAHGTTTFVGNLGTSYKSTVEASSSGRFLLFETNGNMTGERLPGDQYRDLYRYDADQDELLRVWTDEPAHNGSARKDGAVLIKTPDGAGANPAGGLQQSAAWSKTLQLSDDGSKVGFTTAEPLSRDDRNAATDAYLWEAETGQMTLLTDGISRSAKPLVGSQFGGMTPSGDSLFVTSASPLLREHTSGQSAAYVIRKNGGFPAPPAPLVPCVGDSCQGAEVVAPGPFDGAGSSTFVDSGNEVLPDTDSPVDTRPKVRVGKVKTARGSRTRVRVSVPSKGKIRVSGSGLARSSKSAKQAGTYRVTVRLSKRAKRTLRRKHRVKVRVRVRFRPAEGKSSVARRSVTFKTARKKRSKASSRSVRRVSVLSSDVQKGR